MVENYNPLKGEYLLSADIIAVEKFTEAGYLIEQDHYEHPEQRIVFARQVNAKAGFPRATFTYDPNCHALDFSFLIENGSNNIQDPRAIDEIEMVRTFFAISAYATRRDLNKYVLEKVIDNLDEIRRRQMPASKIPTFKDHKPKGKNRHSRKKEVRYRQLH